MMTKLSFNNAVNEDLIWRMIMTFSVISIIICGCESTFATATASTNNDIIGATLCRLVINLTGGIAKATATIAIFSVGIGLFMGKINWGIAATTAAGVGIIFGSAQLVGWLSGSTTNSNCSTSA